MLRQALSAVNGFAGVWLEWYSCSFVAVAALYSGRYSIRHFIGCILLILSYEKIAVY